MPTRAARFSLALFVTLAGLMGYGYELYSSNANMEIPPILALLDPDLYHNDYYVQEMSGFTARTYYNWMIALPAGLGLPLPVVYLLFFAGSLLAFLLALRRIGARLGGDRLAGALLAFLGLAAFTNGTIGMHALFWRSPYPYVLAMGPVAWGVCFCLERRYALGYLLLGLAGLLQLLVGVLPAAMFAPLLVLDAWRQRRYGGALLATALLGLLAALVYVPMRLSGTTDTGLISDADFVRVYGFIRHPHHIVPSHWGWENWTTFLLFVAGGLLLLRRSPIAAEERRRLAFLAIAPLGALLLGYVFVEVVPLALFAKLQLGRTTPFAQLALLAGLAALAAEHARRGRAALAAALVAAAFSPCGGLWLFLLGLLHQSKPAIERLSRGLPARRLWLVPLALVVLFLAHTPEESTLSAMDRFLKGPVLLAVLLTPVLLERLTVRRARLAALLPHGLALGAAAVFLLGASERLPHWRLQDQFDRKVKLGRPLQDPAARIARRLRQGADRDALVLVPPSVASFKLHSRRAVVVDFKCIPYTDRGMIEWIARLEAVLGVPLGQATTFEGDLEGLYRRRSAGDLVNVARRYRASYILTRGDWHQLDFPVADREEGWLLYRIDGEIGGEAAAPEEKTHG